MQSKGTAVLKREEGQSIVMITLVLVVLMALIALVVDVGNAYAQRRIVQNAADAAALAATRELARGNDTTNTQVLAKAQEFAQLNGVDRNTVHAYYFSLNPDAPDIETDLGEVLPDGNHPDSRATGVRVKVARRFDTYLARVVGRNTMDASADSSGQVSKGICIATDSPGLFPFGVDINLFDNEQDHGDVTLYKEYTILGDKAVNKKHGGTQVVPGNFHWLSWDGDTSNPTLEANMHETSRSGVWNVGDMIPGSTGVQSSNGIVNELTARVNGTDPNRPSKILLPIYDEAEGTGSGAEYRVAGFGWFTITGFQLTGNDPYISGYFSPGNSADSEGGCFDVGASTVKLRPAMHLHRTIEGRVAYQYLKTEQPSGQSTYPVDVVLVMDTSGSMADISL